MRNLGVVVAPARSAAIITFLDRAFATRSTVSRLSFHRFLPFLVVRLLRSLVEAGESAAVHVDVISQGLHLLILSYQQFSCVSLILQFLVRAAISHDSMCVEI